MASPVATRRVGRNVNLGTGATGIYVFGPFLPGEGIESISLALAAQASLANSNVVRLSVGVSSAAPATAAELLAAARFLTDGVPNSSTTPGLPLGGVLTPTVTYAATDTVAEAIASTDSNAVTLTGTITGTVTEAGTVLGLSFWAPGPLLTLPLGWVARGEERYLTVSLVAPVGTSVVGSLWVGTCGEPDAAPVVPAPPAAVDEEGCE